MYDKQHFNRTRLVFLLLTGLIFALGLAVVANALPTEVEQAEVSVNLNQLPGAPMGIGGGAAIPIGNGFVATEFQSNGSIIRGRGYAEYAIDLGGIHLVPYLNSAYRGFKVSELGIQNDVGLNLEFRGLGGEAFDVSGGVFGRSGGAFAKPNLFDLGAGNGYDEGALETFTNPDGKTLAGLNPAPTGLSFGDKSSVNLLLQADGNIKGFGVSFKLMPELFSNTDDEATDQMIINVSSSYSLGKRLSLVLNNDFGFQRFRDSGDIEREWSGRASINMRFP